MRGGERSEQRRSSDATTTGVTELDHCSQVGTSGPQEKRNMGQWFQILKHLNDNGQVRRNREHFSTVHNLDLQTLPVRSAEGNTEPSNTDKHADISHQDTDSNNTL